MTPKKRIHPHLGGLRYRYDGYEFSPHYESNRTLRVIEGASLFNHQLFCVKIIQRILILPNTYISPNTSIFPNLTLQGVHLLCGHINHHFLLLMH